MRAMPNAKDTEANDPRAQQPRPGEGQPDQPNQPDQPTPGEDMNEAARAEMARREDAAKQGITTDSKQGTTTETTTRPA